MPPDTNPDTFQTQSTIRSLLDQAGISPRKRYGQHFLIDRNLMKRLVEAAEIAPTDCILEVGAGTGSLTGLLAATGARVLTVEVDSAIAKLAAKAIAPFPNATLLQVDALAGKSVIAPELLEAIRLNTRNSAAPLKLVANLPYDIATPLVIDLLLADLPLVRLCFTVQAEVADRFLAQPDCSDYGPISIIAQALCKCERIAKVPPQAFWPAPNVASAMLRLDPLPRNQRPIVDPIAFSHFVRAFFLHRRKTMGHLARSHSKADDIFAALSAMNLDPRSRPETLTVSQWIHLFQAVGDASSPDGYTRNSGDA
ncbi:MAG TPA: 16S rRNA (adenine(1518)-N(6)/adenine(1519)-N(6))-dimethyltransferase RsmA [Phycisphaerae bacterium]|nr:16S rRNA (adenine(1518)-N(6)/adenine(1519)-N(6))-dimethyltransferase RsmA [Phycisphaerae bacterium]